MKTVIEMAREVGKTKWYGTHRDGTSDFLGAEFTLEQLEHLVELVRAAERERIIAANAPEIERCNAYIKELETAIRARGEA